MSPVPAFGTRLLVLPTLLAADLGAVPYHPYHCESDLALGPVLAGSKKGLSLDDTTFQSCPGRIPAVWPNTKEKVASLRMFKAWDWKWPEENRLPAWNAIRDFAQSNNVKVLVGTQISCNETDDAHDWEWIKEFLKFMGPEHLMALGIGNELELLTWHIDGKNVTTECIVKIWEHGRYLDIFYQRVKELDEMGFSGLTLTTVSSGIALGGVPLFQEAWGARVNTVLGNLSSHFGTRFAFTFNIYTYFEIFLALDPNTTDQCEAAKAYSLCYDDENSCLLAKKAATARVKMEMLTGRKDFQLWLGETGWSYPGATTLQTTMARCPSWSTAASYRTNYENFLTFDPAAVKSDVRPPDHLFWFTVRDAENFFIEEHFGLIKSCDTPMCKLQVTNSSPQLAQNQHGTHFPVPVFVGMASAAMVMLVIGLRAKGKSQSEEPLLAA